MLNLSSLIFVLLLSAGIFAQSPHGSLDLDCSSCHESTTWEIKGKVQFNHDETGFKLAGQHKTINCRSCHNSLVFSEAKSDCFSCHKDIHQNSVGFDCRKCHTPETWIVKDIQNIHRQGRFPLTGVHQKADCIQCHSGYSNLNFQPLGISCYSCHNNDYASAQNPNHIASKFSTDCQGCHNLNDLRWSAKNFAHEFFPLAGMHKLDNCFACHKQGNTFTGLQKNCFACHEQNYTAVKDPDHVKGNFSKQCLDCHTTMQPFSFSTFDHNKTRFQLTGVHINRQCTSCHQTGYTNTPLTCAGCHQANYNNTISPAHVRLSFPTTCETCHNTTSPGWKPALFSIHNNYYQLLGAHAVIAGNCSSCHNMTYTNTPNTCYGCHQQKYASTSNPPHQATGFNTECQTCHTQNAWQPATFEHDAPYFPIYSGEHRGKWNVCSDCHTNSSNYKVFSCITCHDHNQPDMDNEHQGVNGYIYQSSACYSCHPRGTAEGAFNHGASGFPLTGAHVTTQCSQCHQNGYANTPTQCQSCHQNLYLNAPNHVAQNYPTTCETCHNSTAWNQSTFNHANTIFPLTGAHINTTCSNCHITGYTGTPTACLSCHQTNYNNTTNPGHVALALPTECENCHTTNPTWKPATFPAHNTFWQFQGAHISISTNCVTCHNGNYNNTPNTCYGCHTNDFNTAVPNHVAPGFSHECTICHTQNVWNPSTFRHDQQYFPIYSGKHRNKWTTCSQCHPSPSNYTQFTCTTSCHPQGEMNSEHQGISGYVYQSSACLNCHPDGDSKMRNLKSRNSGS